MERQVSTVILDASFVSARENESVNLLLPWSILKSYYFAHLVAGSLALAMAAFHPLAKSWISEPFLGDDMLSLVSSLAKCLVIDERESWIMIWAPLLQQRLMLVLVVIRNKQAIDEWREGSLPFLLRVPWRWWCAVLLVLCCHCIPLEKKHSARPPSHAHIYPITLRKKNWIWRCARSN